MRAAIKIVSMKALSWEGGKQGCSTCLGLIIQKYSKKMHSVLKIPSVQILDAWRVSIKSLMYGGSVRPHRINYVFLPIDCNDWLQFRSAYCQTFLLRISEVFRNPYGLGNVFIQSHKNDALRDERHHISDQKSQKLFELFWVVFVRIGIIVNLMGVQIKLMHNTSLSIDHYVSVWTIRGLEKWTSYAKHVVVSERMIHRCFWIKSDQQKMFQSNHWKVEHVKNFWHERFQINAMRVGLSDWSAVYLYSEIISLQLSTEISREICFGLEKFMLLKT